MSDLNAAQHPRGANNTIRFARLQDSYVLILVFILLDYIAASVASSSWSKVVVSVLLGGTLLLAFRISRAPRIWVILAGIFMFVSTFAAIAAAVLPRATAFSQVVLGLVGSLLMLAPLVILRRIAASTHISGETVLGAVCVYLLYGMSFAYLFLLANLITPGGFFQQSAPTRPTSDFLFFSYTTLTTVGYGDLVPAGALGQALAMVEALLGQIYLVVIVARAVSLWGQDRPANTIHRKPLRRVPRKRLVSASRHTRKPPSSNLDSLQAQANDPRSATSEQV